MIRALLWLQWRQLVNGLRDRGRGGLDNASRIVQVVLPVLAAVLMVPAVLVLAGLGVVGGWVLAARPDGADAVPVVVIIAALVLSVWAVARSFVPALREGLEHHEFLRLQPVPRRLLHRLQLVWMLLEPVNLLFLPGLLLLPLGVLAGGRPGLAVAAAAATVSFAFFVTALGGLSGDVVQLLFRSRRRAEAVTVVFFIALSLFGVVPYAIESRHDRGTLPPAAAPAPETAMPGAELVDGGGRGSAIVEVALVAVPPLAVGRALGEAGGGRVAAAVGPVAAILVWAVALYALSAVLGRRLEETPASSGSGSVRRGGRHAWRVPLLRPAVGAVALAQLRSILRTVRGRMMLASPVIVGGALGVVLISGSRGGGPLDALRNPALMAAFVLWTALSNLSSTMASNQLTVLGRGWLVEMLQPLDDGTLLRGRAAALMLLYAGQTAVVVAVLAVIFPGGPAGLWAGLLVAGPAVLVWLLPLFAALSAWFPKLADLSTVRRGGTVTMASAVVTMAAVPLASAPLIGAGWLALGRLQQPWLFPLLAGVWLAAGAGVWRVLLPVLARIVASRRENLAMVAAGR